MSSDIRISVSTHTVTENHLPGLIYYIQNNYAIVEHLLFSDIFQMKPCVVFYTSTTITTTVPDIAFTTVTKLIKLENKFFLSIHFTLFF